MKCSPFRSRIAVGLLLAVPTSFSSLLLRTVCSAFLFFAWAVPNGVSQTTSTWDGAPDGGGASADANWTTAENWVGDVVPTYSATNSLQFSGTTNRTNINNAGTIDIQDLRLGDNAAPTTGWNLSGGDLRLNGNVLANSISTMTAGTSTIANNIVLTENRTFNTERAGKRNHNITVSGIISDDGSARKLVKTGGGTLTLNGNNSFSGGLDIDGGAITVANNQISRLGTGTVKISNGVLNYSGGGTRTISKNFSQSHNATIQIGGNNATLTFDNAIFNVAASSKSNSRELRLNGNHASRVGIITGVVQNYSSDAGSQTHLVKNHPGTWKLQNVANTFSGRVDVRGGILEAKTIANSGTTSSLGVGGQIRLGRSNTTGQLRYVGTADGMDRSTNRQIMIGVQQNTNGRGGARIVNNAVGGSSGEGKLTFSNATFNVTNGANSSNGSRTLFLGGSNTSLNEITGVIRNNTGTTPTVNVRKEGAGTWVLKGNNTYTGTTVVTGGTLIVDGSIASSSGVTVQAGATLSGSGNLGDVDISGLHSPGNSPGVQNFGDLNYLNGASVLWELTSNTALETLQPVPPPPYDFDQVVVSGDLDFAGSNTFDLDFDLAGSSVDWLDTFWETGNRWLVYDVGGQTTGLANLQLNVANWQDASGDLFDDVFPLGRFYLTQAGSDVYLNFAPVPEPSTVLVLLGGFLSMMLGRRRRKLGSNAH